MIQSSRPIINWSHVAAPHHKFGTWAWSVREERWLLVYSSPYKTWVRVKSKQLKQWGHDAKWGALGAS